MISARTVTWDRASFGGDKGGQNIRTANDCDRAMHPAGVRRVARDAALARLPKVELRVLYTLFDELITAYTNKVA
jgi:hypothetical protein